MPSPKDTPCLLMSVSTRHPRTEMTGLAEILLTLGVWGPLVSKNSMTWTWWTIFKAFSRSRNFRNRAKKFFSPKETPTSSIICLSSNQKLSFWLVGDTRDRSASVSIKCWNHENSAPISQKPQFGHIIYTSKGHVSIRKTGLPCTLIWRLGSILHNDFDNFPAKFWKQFRNILVPTSHTTRTKRAPILSAALPVRGPHPP